MTIDYSELPEHLRAGMQRYIENGVRPGGFLAACVKNELRDAVCLANHAMDLSHVVGFLMHQAPALCWGSGIAHEMWVGIGGKEGFDAAKARKKELA